MDIAIVIPARYGSQRLPGKPMLPVAGRGLLRRVWAIAKAVERVGEVIVATDDTRIAEHVRDFGGRAVMTSPDCRNGTERAHAAIQELERRPDALINLQGDAVLTPPWVVQALVDAFHADPGLGIVTPAVRCTWEQLAAIEAHKVDNPSSGTLVTFDRAGRALYFSKAIIPFLRQRGESARDGDQPPVHRHIGLYGYALTTLDRLATLEPTPLEMAEQLEQLRALENGIPIQVVVVDYRGRTHGSIDTAADIAAVEAIIAREGELLGPSSWI